jgi:hypothetical protein
MDIPEYAHAIEDALLGYERNCRGLDEDAVLRNTKYSAFFLVEMAKRWAERKYDFKRLNREVTIEETVEKSLKATDKYFQRQERKRAPEALRETNADAEELFAYLTEKPKVEDEPEKKDHESYPVISPEEFAKIRR